MNTLARCFYGVVAGFVSWAWDAPTWAIISVFTIVFHCINLDFDA